MASSTAPSAALLRALFVVAACLVAVAPRHALAQGQTPATAQNASDAATAPEASTGAPSDSADASDEEAPQIVYFDLGEFKIKDFRPTRNETADVRFELQIELPPNPSEELTKRVANAKNRLRDQVIVAVRLSSTADFAEPHLIKLRKTILRRINRVLDNVRIESVYLTDFASAEL
ncbi:MAG: flagellar basal body-associated FliL family protein [Planctomycetales bacterium]|nr:flagellar basal body-associated FliL family protein [Planctomycetales bacterium]